MALRDLVGGALESDGTDTATPDWGNRVAQLLYDGERVERSVDLGDDARLVVTSHRVLAFTPDLDAANFRGIDRPNVEGVSTGARSDGKLLERAVRWGVIGLVMLVAGFVVNLDSLVGSVDFSGTAASQVGIGGFMGMMQTMLDLLAQLDDYLKLFGAVFAVLALALLGVFLHGRDRTVVVEVAGGDDLHLPRPTDAEGTVERIEGVLGFGVGHGGPADGTEDDPLGEP